MPSVLDITPLAAASSPCDRRFPKRGNANDPEHSLPSYLSMGTINWSSFRLSSLVSSEQRISQNWRSHHVVLVVTSAVDGLDCHR